MSLVVDTTVIIAVIMEEPHKARLIEMTSGADLLSAPSLRWEIGNAFSAMFKRQRLTPQQALQAISLYEQIPLKIVGVSLQEAVRLAAELNVYAYDAYMITAALKCDCPLLTLDQGLIAAARRAGTRVLEVTP